MNKDFKYWLRWIAVIPGALAAGVLVNFPLHLMLYATLRNFVEPYPELPERLLTPFVSAISFVWCGTKIAPEHKIKTSVVLFSFWVFLSGGFVFLALNEANWMGHQLYFYGGGIPPVIAVVGAFIGLYLVWKREK